MGDHLLLLQRLRNQKKDKDPHLLTSLLFHVEMKRMMRKLQKIIGLVHFQLKQPALLQHVWNAGSRG